METNRPDIQLIANLVVRDPSGSILFVKYDPTDERWWLPGGDLDVYQHPDDRAKQLLDEIAGLNWSPLGSPQIESFRGRRGWHVMFNYLVEATGDLAEGANAAWFPADALPRTMHGKWELDVIRKAIG